jgi:hypothetical protein
VTDVTPTSAYDPEERIPEEVPEVLAPDEPGAADEPLVEDDDGEPDGGGAA